MSRLIDADCLNFEGQHYNKSQMKAILDFIDAQPTSYNPNKVVEQLEELKETYRKKRDNTRFRSTETDNCDRCRADHYLDARIGAVDKSIEIVKGGGVNE